MRPEHHAAFAAALLDPDSAVPAGLVGRDITRRFAVYRNNVVVGLVDALAARFPVVAALVGDDFFRAMAAVFARAEPPRSALLFRYGDGFADFLDRFPPAAEIGYLADVARLEWAMGEAAVAADAAVLGRADLAGLAPEALLGARIDPHPSLRCVASPWPILSLWRAHQPGATPPDVWPESGETVAVLRDRADRITSIALDAGEAACLDALRAGQNFAAAAEAGLAAAPDFDPGPFLLTLIDLDAIVGVTPGDAPT